VSRIVLTDHAIERYMKRYKPSMTKDEAKGLLESRLDGAAPLKRKTLNGEAMWRITAPDVVLVTKRDGSEDVCVTILGLDAVELREEPSGLPYDEEDDEIRESIERMMARDREFEAAGDRLPAINRTKLK